MRSFTRAGAIMTLIALTGSVTGSALAAAAGKGGTNRGGTAAEHRSGKGSWNSNAQWSADPERGWVRANERRQTHDKSDPSERAKQNDGKQKAKGKTKKS